MVENHADHHMNHGNHDNMQHSMGHSMVRYIQGFYTYLCTGIQQ